MLRSLALFLLGSTFAASAFGQTGGPPILQMVNGASTLRVQDKPFLVLGGELGNSSAATAAQADAILPRMRAMHLNTVLMPVAWEQVEPAEGHYDFTILDHWVDVAQANHEHLVLLWFGSWKNAYSSYAPAWVKADAKRFPRALSASAEPLQILSTFGAATVAGDARAFAHLLAHVREKDAAEQTVVMVQVENEVGYLGAGRDRSAEANTQFQSAPPAELVRKLVDNRLHLQPELAANFHPEGKSWREVFGDAANEVFMAWRYAAFIDQVAAAGKQEYALPMFTNAQLPAPGERAGEYPSGGPHPYSLDVYRATAPHIDMFSPDIYWPNFQYWVDRYKIPGNPIFVPESRFAGAALNALYTIGQARALGFAPFDVDRLDAPLDAANARPGPAAALAESYGALEQLSQLLPTALAEGRTRGLLLHATSPRPTQTVALGGYLFQAALSKAWPTNALLADEAGMMILQASAQEFFFVGSGLTVSIVRDPDVDARIAGISSIETVERKDGAWQVQRRLNGDESNQGQQLMMDPHTIRIYRVVLYSNERERHAER